MDRRIQTQFFSSANEELLTSTVLNDFRQRTGGKLSEKQETRLERTITHYMDEVWESNGAIPLPQLNREVIGATVNDFTTYLRRSQDEPTMAMAVNQVVNMPQRPSYQEMETPRLQLTMDTGDRFDQIQKERTMTQQKPPKVPDFRISLEESTLSPLEQFEAAKKVREAEASLVGMASRSQDYTGQASRSQDYTGQSQANKAPIFIADPNQNPTISLAGTFENKQNLPQDILIKQESVVSYKEVEDNLFIWSADRDWVNNTSQSRYNFTINFDTANNRQGFGIGAAVTKKFKNIVRIELIKVILPVEGLENVMNVASFTNGSFALTTNTATQINALSFPYLTLRIPELDGNNYGSDNYLDNAFGIIQYDANWNTDNSTNIPDGRGYIAMIPKFLKCQKVYQPTPLATLNKLTFNIQRPTGGFLSDISDSFRVYGIYPDVKFAATTVTGCKYAGTNLTDTGSGAGNSLFYLIRTYECFSRFTFTKGDRLLFKGLDTTVVTGSPNPTALADLVSWVQDPNGHVLVDIAFCTGTDSGTLIDGYNAAGFANVLIIQAPFNNTASNALAFATAPYIPPVKPFGGTTANNKTLENPLNTAVFLKGRVLNLSHQTHLVLRVITRELDPTSRVRPDNM
jgi:hypothetical protein